MTQSLFNMLIDFYIRERTSQLVVYHNMSTKEAFDQAKLETIRGNGIIAQVAEREQCFLNSEDIKNDGLDQ